MTGPTISVIIPNYNHAHFLKNAVQPYLLQTCPPLEIIIVDDGSQDNSLDIIQDLAATTSLIRLVSLKTNQGVNQAIMEGLKVARGDYVVFTAADDTVERSFLEKSSNVLKRYPQAGLSFCDPSGLIYETNTLYHYPLHLSDKPIYLSPHQLFTILKQHYFTFPSNSCVFKKELLIKSGGFRTELGLGADWFACFVCAFREGVCYIPEFLTTATIRNNSYSVEGHRDGSRQKKTFFKILELLSSTTPDVIFYFKNSAIVYEYSWRALFWLLSSPKYYSYFSYLLLKRLIIRGTWNYLRGALSISKRKRLKCFILKHKITI